MSGCADDQARAQIEDINTRLSQIQDNLSSINNKVSGQKSLDLVNKVSDIQDQINQVNGEISSLKHRQQQFQNTQTQVNQSLQQQITSVNINGKSAASANVAVASADDGSNDDVDTSTATKVSASKPISSNQSDKKFLKEAFTEIKAHKFKEAITKLKGIIATSHDNEVVATANYYMAVANAASGQYKTAIVSAHKYLDNNATGIDAPNALRIIYIAQMQLGLKKSALKTAHEIVDKYPNSDAAKKIKSQLSN